MKKNKKGFTLIELLAVIVILGIIITIVVSNVVKYINQAKEGSFIDAYKVLVKNMQTELMSEGIAGTPSVKQCNDDGSASLTTCNDVTGTPATSSSTYSGLYDKNNIQMIITSSSSNYNIQVLPVSNGSFSSVKISNSDKPENAAVSASTSGQTEGNILNSTIDSNGNISATNSVTNPIADKKKK